MSTRHQILEKPLWQPLVNHPVVPALDLDQLRALDGFFDHLAQYQITALQVHDFLGWASLGRGAVGLENLRSGLEMFDAGDPNLIALEEARSSVLEKEQHKGTSSKGRQKYDRSVSVSFANLPSDWRVVLNALQTRREAGDKRAPAPDILARMTQKLGQYIFVMRRESLPEELHQQGLTAFYADLSTRLSIHSGEPLRPATLRATWEELERFARHRGTYPDTLMAALRRTLVTLRDQEGATSQLKFGKLHGIGRPPDIVRNAFELLEQAETIASAPERHKRRNRAAAFALPAILPLRREWDRIVFGKTFFWSGDRYRFRHFKPDKTALLDGRREFPGSVHPDLGRFVDALVLQDNDPKYLPALREDAEASCRPLFVHPNGTAVSENYVTNVWHQLAGTGAHIARTLMHDYFGATGEEGVRKAMIMCNQNARQTADRYIGPSVAEQTLELASADILDEFEALTA